jgi:hypothetical protein
MSGGWRGFVGRVLGSGAMVVVVNHQWLQCALCLRRRSRRCPAAEHRADGGPERAAGDGLRGRIPSSMISRSTVKSWRWYRRWARWWKSAGAVAFSEGGARRSQGGSRRRSRRERLPAACVAPAPSASVRLDAAELLEVDVHQLARSPSLGAECCHLEHGVAPWR